MIIEVVSNKCYRNTSDLKLIAFFEDEDIIKKYNGLDKDIKGVIEHIIKVNKFTGKYKEIYGFVLPRQKKPNKILIAGRGKLSELTIERIGEIFPVIFEKAIELNAKSMEIPLLGGPRQGSLGIKEVTRIVSESALIIEYGSNKNKGEKGKNTPDRINIICDDDAVRVAVEGLNEAMNLENLAILDRD
ncbi:M17 family peptidase N-terminal domain-containing protein [Sporosalibacterium faouarense]|uniref:M17 family peptidase N-terminal domain-containing protein n=1 Tax=Sporosalibacterium faouarense TaxID=516123 RepID=UPI00192CAD8A